VADHNTINLRHHTQLHHTITISSKPRHKDHIIKEATEIEFHPNNMNREDAFCLRKSWKPLICSLKDHGEPPLHTGRSGFPTLIRAQNIPSLGTH
jgi:hypothetical protein